MIINSELDLKTAFATFDKLVVEMGDNTDKQAEVRALAEAIQTYEKEHVAFPMPTTLVGIIELKMYEMKLRQRDYFTPLSILPT